MKALNRRGTAMVEFVMCIPLLALLIAGMFFLGWAMRNQQKVKISNRYAAWRDVHNAKARTDASSYAYTLYGEPGQERQREEFLEDYTQGNVIEPTVDRLIDMFLGSRSDNVRAEATAGPAETQQQLLEAIRSPDAEGLAERTVAGDFPGSVSVHVASEFRSDMELWEYFARSGGLGASHVRDGVQWRRWQTSTLEAIQEQFFSELDQAVGTIPNPTLQNNMRSLYRRNW